jgi:hypothetical protein
VCQQLLAGLRDTTAPLQPTAPQPTAAAAWDGNHLRGGSHHLKGEVAAALDRALRSAQLLLSVPGFVAAAQDLLGDEDDAVRARAVAMLEGRVGFMERGDYGGGGDGFSRDEASLFVDMVPELAATLREEKNKKEEEKEGGHICPTSQHIR